MWDDHDVRWFFGNDLIKGEKYVCPFSEMEFIFERCEIISGEKCVVDKNGFIHYAQKYKKIPDRNLVYSKITRTFGLLINNKKN